MHTNNMEIAVQRIDHGSKGYFLATEGEKEAGRMSYTWAGEKKLIIDHTEVDPAFAGRSVGKKLLMELVQFARENQIKVLPLCPFAKSVFAKMESIRDVLN